MAYTDVFGGELLFPSQLSYLLITTAVDVTLQWPREQQIGGTNVVADFLDIDATAGSLNIDMPSASATGTGNKTTINNVGSNTFTVRDSTGGTIQSVAPGEQWVLVLTDNSTAAGSWSTFQLGATVSVASASALAGAGIKAITTTLNQMIDSDVEAVTPFTVVDGDRAKCLVYTAGAGTCNLPSPGTVGNDWFFLLRNSGSGTLNVLPPSGQIDGGASLNMDTNDSAFIFTDGTDFFTVGFGQGNTLAFDYVSIAVPGSGDFVLSGANLDRIAYNFTGALTGNRRIVVPNTVQQYWVDNQTSGSFTLEIDTAAGAGQIIPQGESAIVYCDATDVINAVSSTSVTFPITIGQGGTGATTVGGAQTNLQVPPDTRNLTAGVGLTGGGDLTADRTFDLDATSPLNDDHSAVILTAGGGLAGGGDITASRSFDVGAGEGVVVNANDVAIDWTNLVAGSTVAANVDYFNDLIAFYDDSVSAHRSWDLDTLAKIGVTERGSFTPTFTGFAAPPSNAMDWVLTGQIGAMDCNAGNVATSNATTMTITNIPSQLRPNSQAINFVCVVVRDNGTDQFGIMAISPTGTATFGLGASSGGFTASGSKGLPGNWTATFMVSEF